MSKIILIGIGNEFRQDDGVGLAIARQLQPKLPSQITITEASGEGVGLMQMWQNAEIVYLFDAIQSGNKSGTIHRLDAQQQSIPTKFFNYSTHAFSVAEAIELARILNQLPPQLIIYGIEGKKFTCGLGLSPEVEQAAAEVVKRVYLEVSPLVSAKDCGTIISEPARSWGFPPCSLLPRRGTTGEPRRGNK